jgi:hypothetical protein
MKIDRRKHWEIKGEDPEKPEERNPAYPGGLASMSRKTEADLLTEKIKAWRRENAELG